MERDNCVWAMQSAGPGIGFITVGNTCQPSINTTPLSPLSLFTGAVELPASPSGYSIKLKHVNFGYREGHPILHDVSLEVPAGSSLALVGTSGSGKSTILRLLYRFYDAQAGRIEVNGLDIRDVKLDSLRRALGAVPQDLVLFNDTIRYNIAYGRRGATDAEVEQAARQVGTLYAWWSSGFLVGLVTYIGDWSRVELIVILDISLPHPLLFLLPFKKPHQAAIHDRILTFPKGYDTEVGERGLKLSGGEKQRVALARAFLKDPPLLLCDEATSALDTATEKAILASLFALTKGRTTLLVAHRLSTAAQCDQIAVLEQVKGLG